MENMIVINGKQYFEAGALIKAMVKECVLYTDVNDYEVSQDEANAVRAFQSLLKSFESGRLERLFREGYVQERFIKRTI